VARKHGVAESKAVAAGTEASSFIAHAAAPILMPADPLYSQQMQSALERITGPALGVGILSLVWMILRARGPLPGVFSEANEVLSITLLWGFLFVLVSAIGLMSASNHGR
jgi:hypothetical protein